MAKKQSKEIGLFKEAVAFWGLVKNQQIKKLGKYVKSNNPFLRIVAMIESLPTKIWRRLLKKGNIDFVSFESCLRRLDKKQIKMIEATYNSYKNQESEKISWWEKIKNCLGSVSAEEEEDRYASHHAFCNIFGLGFGFVAYHNAYDDTRASGLDPRIFFRLDGKEAQIESGSLYKKLFFLTRVWMSDKKIEKELGRRFCLGFWHTLFVSIGLTMSTVAFVTSLVMLLMGDLYLFTPSNLLVVKCHWILILFGAIAPFWIGMALIKRFIPEKQKEFMGEILESIAGICIIGAILFVLLFLVVLVYPVLSLVFGKVLSALIILVVLTQIGYGILKEQRPKWFWMLLWGTVFLVLVRIGCDYLSEILAFFKNAFCWIWSIKYFLLFLIAPFLLILPVHFYKVKPTDELVFSRMEKRLEAIGVVLCCFTGAVYIYQIIFSKWQFFGFFLFSIILTILFFIERGIVLKKDPRKKEIEMFQDDNLFELLLKNKSFWSLDKEVRLKILSRVKALVNFSNSRSNEKILIHLLPIVDERILKALEEKEISLSFCCRQYDVKLIFFIIDKMAEGSNFRKAFVMAKTDFDMRRRQRSQKEKIEKIIFSPMTLLFKWGILICNHIIQATSFIMLIKKMCPMVTRNEEVK